jgi:RimJ/RimL family protein N-acetyltransferase
MIELTSNEFTTLSPLLENVTHNRALVYSVLERNHPGRVFANRKMQTTAALIVTKVNFLFFLGSIRDATFNNCLPGLIIDRLARESGANEIAIFAFEEETRQMLERVFGDERVQRLVRKQFTFNPERFHQRAKSSIPIPEGMELKPLTNQLAAKIQIDTTICNFKRHEFGFYLAKGADVVSACYSIFTGGGEAEIDILTAEDYQGQGLGTITATAFIEESLKRGLRPNWACWPFREASCALARKLGFEEMEDLPALLWVRQG